jgi:glycerol uptake facilitator-like aquaporin
LQNSRITNRLSDNQKRFFAELIGTFVVVVFATGSVVLSIKYSGTFGLWFVALAPAVAVAIMVRVFGKISMAHFNPAVTVAFFITKHMPKKLFPLYLGAEIIGALLGSVFVKYVIGTEANLGANAPDYHFTIPLIIGVEILATALLMGVIMVVVHTKGLQGFGGMVMSGIVIGTMVGLDIFFFAFISGASMNPIRALAPAIVSGYLNDLWLYWTAPFIGSSIIAVIYRKFANDRLLQ